MRRDSLLGRSSSLFSPFATKLTTDRGFAREGYMMLLRGLKSLLFMALFFLALQHQAPLSQSRYVRLGQPAAEKTIQDFLRAMGALIGNPWVNGTASVWT